uniref:DUF4476 domain-containing protein n=1 Tax=Steinernema glaseri TaxID=37863 RepID=A0A1I7ZV65_9BILA
MRPRQNKTFMGTDCDTTPSSRLAPSFPTRFLAGWSFLSTMGAGFSSAELHDSERAMRLKLAELEVLDYCEQPDDDVLQLDTENDQRGSVAVEHVYKKIRDVYGQAPRDLRHKVIDFGEHVLFKGKRPLQTAPSNRLAPSFPTRFLAGWSFLSTMGAGFSSAELHDSERAMRLKLAELEVLDYCEQPDDDVLQLDTENDQRGSVAVEHVYKKIRDVYGQAPRDLRHKVIDFGEHVLFKGKRPSPYDFPAFEHEKLLNEANHMRLSQETAARDERRTHNSTVTATAKTKESKLKTKSGVYSETTARSSDHSNLDKSKQQPKKISHNAALDHCSLEDE